MSVVLLVRHGQASFGTHDYDRLSGRGVEQSRILGADLRARGIIPESVVCGAMKRQRQTARGIMESFASTTDAEVDAGWNEFSATDLLNALPDSDPDARSDSRLFQRVLEEASARWASGDHDQDYVESFGAFTDRVDAALDRIVGRLDSGQTTMVVSSSGAIAWAAARLLGGGFAQWLALNRVTVNAGVTKIVSGSSGASLVTFNEHAHLSSDQITYR